MSWFRGPPTEMHRVERFGLIGFAAHGRSLTIKWSYQAGGTSLTGPKPDPERWNRGCSVGRATCPLVGCVLKFGFML